jgi:L-rhamnose isomerase
MTTSTPLPALHIECDQIADMHMALANNFTERCAATLEAFDETGKDDLDLYSQAEEFRQLALIHAETAIRVRAIGDRDRPAVTR